MKRKEYDKQLIKWVKNHYWDSLEKDKALILRHLRTFVGDEAAYAPQLGVEAAAESRCKYDHSLLKSRLTISLGGY